MKSALAFTPLIDLSRPQYLASKFLSIKSKSLMQKLAQFATNKLLVCFESEHFRVYWNLIRMSYLKISYFFLNISFEIRDVASLSMNVAYT